MSNLPANLAGLGSEGFKPDARFWIVPEPEPVEIPLPEEPQDPIAMAYADGYAAGMAEANSKAEASIRETDAARERFAASYTKLDGQLAEEFRMRLHETVVALCEATLAPLALDQDALSRRVASAIAMFVRADDERVIHLHPDDLQLVADQLPPGWQATPDASLDRGALRVETTTGGVEDGPVQWRAAIMDALRLC